MRQDVPRAGAGQQPSQAKQSVKVASLRPCKSSRRSIALQSPRMRRMPLALRTTRVRATGRKNVGGRRREAKRDDGRDEGLPGRNREAEARRKRAGGAN